ncbi:phosphopantetheine-binding protein [Streptomyces sp. SM11]|uniref:phosphopantetheine-binding protein n=1 Tax=Streptomyces sp. SM11 TaxID=565557 RepID=UPI000CD5055C|nr:phosphopantetheine-binding protein [Streptomyces sp. SM11]
MATIPDAAAGSSLEEQVTRIWAGVLGATGEDGATFIELGGQSVSAVRIATRIQEELDIWVDVGVLFDDPDLPTFIAAVVRTAEAAGADGSRAG